jgi:hypothetical protein
MSKYLIAIATVLPILLIILSTNDLKTNNIKQNNYHNKTLNNSPYLMNLNKKEKHISKKINDLTNELELTKNKENLKIKLEIAKLQNEKEILLQKMKNEKELEIAKLQMKTQKEEIQTNKEIAISNNKIKELTSKTDVQNEQIKIIAISIISFLSILIGFIIANNNRKAKIKINEDKIKHEKEMKEKELNMKLTTTIIETIGNEKTDTVIQQQLLSFLKSKEYNNKIEYKK